MANNKIAIIVTWFGPLPVNFNAWLKSAEYNKSIDFLCFFDHEFESNSSNIKLIKTTLANEVQRIAAAVNSDITIDNAYKFCDLRPFFGIGYKEFLDTYGYWGYCDIDMVFGDIRSFLTDNVLNENDRFYEWGYLSIFKNEDRMNNLIRMDGCIYSMNEIFKSKAKCTPEEHYGLHRISEMNEIKWYREKDFADFYIPYSSFILNQRKNYEKQAFYWENGKVFQAFEEQGKVKVIELAFLHWQKRMPVIKDDGVENGSYFITPTALVEKKPGIPTVDQITEINPVLSENEIKEQGKKYRNKKIRDFLNSSLAQKKIWLRQKWFYFKDSGKIIESKICRNRL